MINSISKDRFVLLIKRIEAECSWNAPKETIKAWWDLFSKVPEDKLTRAFGYAIKDITYKPLPKHIFDGLTKAGYVPPVHIKATGMINHDEVLPVQTCDLPERVDI